jgi:hypothetical protein
VTDRRDHARLGEGSQAVGRRTLDDYAGVVQLQKWQRNLIYDAVVAGELDPAECTFDYDDAQSRVSHVPSQSYFLIQGDPSKYTMTAVVGHGLAWPSESFPWLSVPGKVERWARDVRRDLNTPDLWAELRRKHAIATGAGYEDVANTPFSPDEQTEILEQVREIKEFVNRTDSVSEAKTLSLEAKLDQLAAAAGRVGRRDWQLMFGGVILDAILQQLLPPEAVSGIFEMVGNALGHLLGGNGVPQLPTSTPPASPPLV